MHLDAFVDKTQETCYRNSKIKFTKEHIKVAGIDSEYALYDEGISSFGASDFIVIRMQKVYKFI